MATEDQRAVVVEEPFMGDLWFDADQCPAGPPPEPKGLGDFYDPWPQTTGPGIVVQPQALGDYPPEDFYNFLADEKYYATDAQGRTYGTEELIKGLERNRLFISSNDKTGASFNIRIAAFSGTTHYGGSVPGTCRPTRWCFDACYAKTSHFTTWERQTWETLSRQQRRYLQNLLATIHYENSPQGHVDRVADDIVEQVMKAMGRTFQRLGIRPNLRWNGGGDFNPGSARIVNTIAQRHPDFLVWGFTRKADTATILERRENIRVLVSTDPSTPPFGDMGDGLPELLRTSELLGQGLAYATALEGAERLEDIIEEARKYSSQSKGPGTNVRVVFGYHCMQKHTYIGASRECTCSNPRVVGGCQECRWCMMTDQEIAQSVDPEYGQPILTPVQMFMANGGEPTPMAGYEDDPMGYEEAFDLPFEEEEYETWGFEIPVWTEEREREWQEEEAYYESTRPRLSGMDED